MPEETKEEISAKLNELLKTDIKFEKLSKEELTQLCEAIDKIKVPLPLIDRPIGEILDARIGNRPLREQSLADLFGLPKERGGILGFGILGGRGLLDRGRPEAEKASAEEKT